MDENGRRRVWTRILGEGGGKNVQEFDFMSNEFNLCPICGSKNVKCPGGRKWVCPDCGFDLYNNVAAAVGVIIQDKYKNVLFEVRAKEPRKGFVALPGGFVDCDESAEEAIIRECREEIGVDVSNPKFVCTNPNTYPYKNFVYKTCDIFFTVALPDKYDSIEDFIKALKPQESEVVGFVSYKVESMEDIEKIPLAFDSAKKTLVQFIGGR